MIKRKGQMGVAIVALVAILVAGLVFLSNFMIRTESVSRTIIEGEIIQEINIMEFVKRDLSQALSYSFYQASYDVGMNGGLGGTSTDIQTWSTYSIPSYPDGWKDNLVKDMMQRFNGYAAGFGNPVDIPMFTGTVEQRTEAAEVCGGQPDPCSNFGLQDCKNQIGCQFMVAGLLMGCAGTPLECGQFETQACTLQKGCQLTQADSTFYAATVSAADDLNIPGDYELSDSSTFVKKVDYRISNLFDIGKTEFIDSDSVGPAVTAALADHPCDYDKTQVDTDIRSKISDLQFNLNSRHSSENVNFALSVNGIQFDPSCSTRVSVKVLTTIKDMSDSYLVYDYSQNTLEMRNMQLNFFIISGNYQV